MGGDVPSDQPGWRVRRRAVADAGQGVALGDRDLVQDAITAGRLAAPFDLALDQGLAYYLIYPAHRGQLGKIRTLRAFLVGALGVEG